MIIVTGQLATTINFHSPQFSGWFLILFMGCKFLFQLSLSSERIWLDPENDRSRD